MLTKPIFNAIQKAVDKIVPDANERLKLKDSLVTELLDADKSYLESLVKIQTSSSGVRWIDGIKHLVRPIITFMVMGRLLQSWITGVEISSNEWLLLQIVIGFYFVSRGAEKMIKKML